MINAVSSLISRQRVTTHNLLTVVYNSYLFRIAAMTSWIKIKHIYNNK